jgi:hypothetical protein
VTEQVRVTQSSALKDNACALLCVYDAAALRLLRVEIRGKSSAASVESADYGKGLVENLMELLQNAGDFCNYLLQYARDWNVRILFSFTSLIIKPQVFWYKNSNTNAGKTGTQSRKTTLQMLPTARPARSWDRKSRIGKRMRGMMILYLPKVLCSLVHR